MSENSESLREALGLPRERVFYEKDPPRPVDLDQLRAWHRNELDEATASEVRNLTLCFREWAEADREVCLEEARKLFASETEWMTAEISWEHAQQLEAAACAALLVAIVRRQLGGPLKISGLRGGGSGREISVTELQNQLAMGAPLTLDAEGRWLHVSMEEGTVKVRAGKSPIDQFTDFLVQFRRGSTVVMDIQAEGNVATLLPEHFEQARNAEADALVILEPAS